MRAIGISVPQMPREVGYARTAPHGVARTYPVFKDDLIYWVDNATGLHVPKYFGARASELPHPGSGVFEGNATSPHRQGKARAGERSVRHIPKGGRTVRRVALILGLVVLGLGLGTTAYGQGAGVEIKEPPVPAGIDVFNLNLGQTRAFSRSKNFEVVGQSYFKVPERTQSAKDNGLGCGFNTPRVHKGIALLGGYNSPPTCFGIVIADVSDPQNMKVLSFIPCKAGTRCNYLRWNTARNILVFGNSRNADNPIQPPAGTPTDSGWSFWDISDPAHPVELGHLPIRPNGTTHGMEIDDQFLYGCGQTAGVGPVSRDELQIIRYNNPSAPVQVSALHIQGQRSGEGFAPEDQLNPDGTNQIISCHEINFHNDRLYIAYRDAGLVIVDVSNRSNPRIIGRLDYVPPFNGGSLGAAHTSAPVVVDPDEHPSLVVHTDEIFTCPPGFGRIIDVSDLQNPQVVAGERPANLQVLSSYRLPHVDDAFDSDTGQFVCRDGQQSIHQPWFDFRSPSLFYQAWYDQGLRAWDISNPFLPREVGYYLSPRYEGAGRVGRHIREAFQDPDTGLIYMTDGNGGGLTVLRWTGPIPPRPPIPGAR